MNQELIKKYENMSYEEFKEEQNKYDHNGQFRNWIKNYFYGYGSIFKDFAKSIIDVIIIILLMVIFPLLLLYKYLNLKLYKGSKLNYYLFKRIIKNIKNGRRYNR